MAQRCSILANCRQSKEGKYLRIIWLFFLSFNMFFDFSIITIVYVTIENCKILIDNSVKHDVYTIKKVPIKNIIDIEKIE